MAVGVALTIINTRAVMEALFGVADGFRAHPEIRHRRPPGESGSARNTGAAAAGCLMPKSPSALTSWR